MLHIICDALRINDADALESEALLTLEPGNRIGEPERQRMGSAVQKVCCEERWHIGRAHRAIGTALRRSLHLHERLEEIGAAGAVAYEVECNATAPRLSADGGRDLARTHGERTRIPGNVDAGAHLAAEPSAISASNASGVTRPYSRPSIIAAGEQAQLPRQ